MPDRRPSSSLQRLIDVVRGILSACDRAEQGHAQHASRAEFLFMRLQGGYDMGAFHGTNFAQLLLAGNRLTNAGLRFTDAKLASPW
jgi:hypothetical protein